MQYARRFYNHKYTRLTNQRDEEDVQVNNFQQNLQESSDTDTNTNTEQALNMRFELQELVTKEQNSRRRIGLILCLLALGILIIIVAVLVVNGSSSTNSEASSTNHKFTTNNNNTLLPTITLEDYLEGHLVPHTFNATWVSDNTLLYRDIQENVVLQNIVTGEKRILLSANQTPHAAFDFHLSPDKNYLLIGHNYQKLYSRYSFVAQYTIVDLKTNKQTALTANKEKLLQLAVWAPERNSLVYIHDNNIFFRPSIFVGAEIQLTSNGEPGRIYNGIPDWVYEEEVFSSNTGIWLSPKGNKLAFITLNDSNVGVMNIPVYGQPENPDFQYPKTIPLRYPKTGTPNPQVGLVTIDLNAASDFRSVPVFNSIPPPTVLGSEPILSAVTWANDSTVCAVWLNRIQNEAAIISCDSISAHCNMINHVKEDSGWLEMFTAPIFSQDGTKMILIMSQDQGPKHGAYKHITMLEHKPNGKETPLTHGLFVVSEILKWDEHQQIIYFLATSEQDPAARHLYTVTSNQTDPKIECITCERKKTLNSKPCTYNDAVFSSDSSHYVLNCAGPNVPEISIYDNKHQKLATWEENEELQEFIQDKSVPKVMKIRVEITAGFIAHVLLQLPPNIDTSGNVKYPMIVNVYGGPDSFSVVNKFNLNWFSYLAANKSIIVASIDGRGSGLKGDKFLFAGYGHLGTVEIQDQINVTRHLQRTLPYVDNNRTAIWGWSYGGYASGLALAKDTENIFKCGISIAPVTDWTLYDSIYTERFMGLPTENRLQVYREASLLNKVEQLRNKQYLLIHGTLDDNVHYQQSMLLARALELSDIQFRQQSYPDEDHSLSSVRKHLYHTFENFLDECFEPDS